MVMSSAGGLIALLFGFYPIFYICIAGEAIGIAGMSLFLVETHRSKLSVRRDSLWGAIKTYIVPEREIMPMYFIMVIMGFGYGVGTSIFNGALVESFGYSTLQLGILNTVFSLAWGVSSIPLGKVADWVGKKPMLFGSCVCSITTALGFALFHSFEAFIIFNVVSAITQALWMPSWVALVAGKVSSMERSKALGKLDAYSRLAGISAPYIAGVIYSDYGFSAPLIVMLCFAVVWTIMVLRLDTHVDAVNYPLPKG
jgi:MFS family permease